MIELRLIVGSAILVLVFGAGWIVRGWKEAAVDKAVADTREAALEGAAEAIAKIKVENRTIYAKVQREVVEKPVYRECTHDAETRQKIDTALVPQP